MKATLKQSTRRRARRRPPLDKLLKGDCTTLLRKIPTQSVDLIVTSPPYADQRMKIYGGVPIEKYVEWFLPISAELYRVLKPQGSFVLNIKERVSQGERHTYVLELILALRRQGWLWTEEYIWHKKNCHPGKWPNRFRDAWERCLHFTRQRQFVMNQESVRIPMGDWKTTRLKKLSVTDQRRDESRVKSGFGKRVENWVGRELAFPSNVLHMATECGNQNHSATFPLSLPKWFIQLLTDPGATVLDPFMGSGTTALAAKQLGRHYLGIELRADYIALARRRLKRDQQSQAEKSKHEPKISNSDSADVPVGRVRNGRRPNRKASRG